MKNTNKLSPIEEIKKNSKGLRGTLKESLTDCHTGNIRPDDEALIKFHGMYVQDDRDRRAERAEKKLDKLFSFMIRLRLPGGYMTPKQWLQTHELSEKHGTGTIKITTRQTIQLHGLLKFELRELIQGFFQEKLDAIAACGDVNRNVTCSAHPTASPIHQEVHQYATQISALLLPKTKAYYEIWIDDTKVYEPEKEKDPLYQEHYLPRKFKIGIAVPPDNDVDIFTNDIGLIAIIENEKLQGFNIAIGGGLSTTHGNPNHYARLASIIGFVDTPEKMMKIVYEVVTTQRDYGNRTDRKLARLKYTVDTMGLDNFKNEVERRAGIKLEPAKPFNFNQRSDRYGWSQNHESLWFYTLFVENGLINPTQKQFLYQVAQLNLADFLFSCNQNLILGNIKPEHKPQIIQLLQEYQLTTTVSAIRQNAIACVALPTCPLALAEGQRYLPSLIGKIEPLLIKHGLKEEPIVIRMTGCPNGCGRPYVAEIGLVGTASGHYNLMLGGDRLGTRLNTIYKKNIDEVEILETIDTLLEEYVKRATKEEEFGDFCQRYLQL